MRALTSPLRRALAALTVAALVLALAWWQRDPVARAPARVGGAAVVDPTVVVNVRDHGALGNGVRNDTSAIQRANDAVAAMGGGRVSFPAGTYIAGGVIQDSRVEFYGEEGAVLKHPSGSASQWIVTSRVRETTGSIPSGSTTLRVADLSMLEVGSPIAIRAAGGPSTAQQTTLVTEASPEATVLDLEDTLRVSRYDNVLLVGSEIVGYRGSTTTSVLSVRRGLYGSTAQHHPAGTRVSQLRVHYANVLAIKGSRVTVDRPVTSDVAGAPVYVGAIQPSVRNLRLDGNRASSRPGTGSTPVTYRLARWATVAGSVVHDGKHGAVSFDRGTRDSLVIDNDFHDNGRLEEKLGSAVWIFRGGTGNEIRQNRIGGSTPNGIIVDDRTTSSTEWDASSSSNTIGGNTIDLPDTDGTVGIFVVGSSTNVIEGNVLRGSVSGIRVSTSEQGTRPVTARANVIRGNRLRSHATGIYVSGIRNTFERNAIRSTAEPVSDQGIRNRFVSNRF